MTDSRHDNHSGEDPAVASQPREPQDSHNGEDPATASQPRVLGEADAVAMRTLFAEVFGHPMTPALWEWKYRRSNAHSVGVFRAGELIAHYGGLGARIVFKGEPSAAIQIIDVMVRASARQATRRQGAFFQACSYFMERFVGYDQPYLFSYGFPNDRAMRLAEHLEVYEPVGRMHELTWDCSAAPPLPWWYRVRELDAGNFAGAEPALNALWQRLRHDLREHIVVEKNAAWIGQRYLRHPEQRYRVFLVQNRFGTPQGLFVMKREPERIMMMDMVGSLDRWSLLLRAARAVVHAEGCATLVTWITETFVSRLAIADVQAKPLPITIPVCVWMNGPSSATLRDLWWLLPGDTDFL